MIPCNSVHIATSYLHAFFGEAFVPINKAVISQIGQQGRKGRFLILGTDTTVRSCMYQESLRQLGCNWAILPHKDQVAFDDFIFGELVCARMQTTHLDTLRRIETQFMEPLGADHVILACTELCYLVQAFSQALPFEIDSLNALHDAGIERLEELLLERATHEH